MKAANVDVEPYWPSLFAKALEGVNVKDLITNIGSGAGAGAAAAPGAAVAEKKEEKKEEKKKEESEEEEEDDDMGFGMYFHLHCISSLIRMGRKQQTQTNLYFYFTLNYRSLRVNLTFAKELSYFVQF